MGRLIHKGKPTKGIDFDTTDQDISSDRVRNRLNMRSSMTEGDYGGDVNVKGNTLINYDLPEGENTIIGALDDNKDQSIIYFLYNSNLDHKILRYFPLQNKIVEVLGGVPFKFSKYRKITGHSLVDGKILTFTDGKPTGNTVEGEPLRSLDIIKATLDKKKVCYEVLGIGDTFFIPDTNYSAIIHKPDGTTEDIFISIAPAYPINTTSRTLADLYTYLAEKINNSPLSPYLEAEGCGGCSLKICFKLEGDYEFELKSTIESFHNIPENRYPRDFTAYHINLLRWPPLCHPSYTPESKDDIGTTFLDKRVFQFAYRIIYQDNQKSTISPFSAITTELVPCGATRSPYNCLVVDFTNDYFNDPLYLSEIKYVELLVRENNTGVLRVVEQIDRCELGFPTQQFCFANDGTYAALSEQETYKSAESGPLIASAHGVANNRYYFGGTKEGYNNLKCLDAKVELSYEEIGADEFSCDGDFVTITGRITIRNDFITGQANGNVDNHQPIHDYGSGPVYGGLANQTNPAYDLTHNFHPIPLGGFVVYAAGTPYFGVSEQDKFNDIPIRAGDRVVYNTSNKSDARRLADVIGGNRLYHNWKIERIPKSLGKVIIRVASHLCDFDGDYGQIHNLNNGLEWQKSSTFIKSIGGQDKYEIVVDLNHANSAGVIDLSFTNQIILQDMTDPDIRWTSCTAAYIIDALNDHTGDTSAIAGGINIEGAVVNVLGASIKVKNGISCPGHKADHNGFFWNLFQFGAGRPHKDRDHYIALRMGSNTPIRESGQTVYRWDFQPIDNNLSGHAHLYAGEYTNYFIVYNHNPDVSNCFRTFISGSIKTEDGTPLEAVKIVGTNSGNIVFSDFEGNFNFSVYANGILGVLRHGDIFIYPSKGCCPYIEVNEQSYFIPSFSCNGKYNPDNPYVIKDFIGVVTGFEGERRWKHRNLLNFGIKYYDREGRSCMVQHSKKMDVYIPFMTEDTGDTGIPILKFNIAHQPPEWAHRYQIVRTLNSMYNKYLQYAINQIKYVKAYGDTIDETTFEAGDATEIYFSLSSLVDYENENSGSILSWEFNPGDRITIYKNKDGDFEEKFLDFEVLNSKINPTIEAVNYLVIKNRNGLPKMETGVQVEVYSPKLDTDVDVFYEFAQCFKIIDPETANRRHAKGFEGLDQVLGSSPATGLLNSGDTYMQNRTMPLVNPEDPLDRITITNIFESEYIYENIAESRQQSIGRPSIIDKEHGETFFSNRIRYTNRYVPDSRINGLNIFDQFSYVQDPSSSKEMDSKYGAIVWLGFVGNVIKVVCLFKIVPVYVGSTPIYDLADNSNLAATSKVATLGLPLITDRGSQNPESITIENGELYGFDADKGVWWRNTNAGNMDISDYLAQTYFIGKAKEVRESLANNRFVYSKYDKQHDELLCTIHGETICFGNLLYGETRRNEWMGFYSFIPEFYGRTGEVLVTFINGQLWLQNSNDIRCNFFGVQYDYGVDLVINNEPDHKKTFWNISVKASSLFKTPSKGISLGLGQSDELEIVSELSTDFHWVEKEGDYYADFLRDMNDPVFADVLDGGITALLRGRALKGDVLKIKLRNIATKKVFLYSVYVESSLSHQQKK